MDANADAVSTEQEICDKKGSENCIYMSRQIKSLVAIMSDSGNGTVWMAFGALE